MVVLLLFVVLANIVGCVSPREVNHLSRDEQIRFYFLGGFPYKVILLFLSVYHGIQISMRTLKRVLLYLELRRRKNYSSLYDVGNCLMVSINIQIIHACMSGCLLMCIMVVGI